MKIGWRLADGTCPAFVPQGDRLRPMNISVFASGIFSHRIAKQRAKRMVASGQYRWNGSREIHLVPPQPKSEAAIRFKYIPEGMPPREVPGVYFQAPKSDTWIIQHRTAWQSWPQNGASL